MLLPALGNARGKARTVQCISNLKQLMLYVLGYANDHDDYIMSTNYYADVLYGHAKDRRVFHCPEDTQRDISSYGFNYYPLSQSGRRKITQFVGPSLQYVFVESKGDVPIVYCWCNSSNLEYRQACPRHQIRGINIGYLDGHAATFLAANPLDPYGVGYDPRRGYLGNQMSQSLITGWWRMQ